MTGRAMWEGEMDERAEAELIIAEIEARLRQLDLLHLEIVRDTVRYFTEPRPATEALDAFIVDEEERRGWDDPERAPRDWRSDN